MNVLINAYSCSPNMGSEPGMAWNWIINLSKRVNLFVITEGRWKLDIEKELKGIENVKFFYLPVSPNVHKMSSNQGDWRFYYYYRKWQLRALRLAIQICKEEHIDVIHQLNMIGFREPGFLWRINDIPFVWGPVNAKEAIPENYLIGCSFKEKLFVKVKNSLNKIQLKYSTRVRNAMSTADKVIAASSDSAISIRKYFNIDSYLLNESGCEITNVFERNWDTDTLDILWVGKFLFTKQLTLALKIISEISNTTVNLHIVGGKPDEEILYKNKAKSLGISNQCFWYGKIRHEEVISLMKKSHLFLFTSIAEGTPHVVLEAVGVGLPVICFDTCGQGDVINDKVGCKIRLSNPEQSINEFANQILIWKNDRELLKQMSKNCISRQLELSWDNKVDQMVDIYKNVLINR